jgi:hypothetical protein
MSKIPKFNADLDLKKYYKKVHWEKHRSEKPFSRDIGFFVGKTVNKDALCWFIFLNLSSDLISAYNSGYFFTS